MVAQARVEGLPDCLLEGELRRCTLVLRNTGASALRGIRAVTSGPGVHLAPGNAELASASADSILAGELLHALILEHICIPAHRTVGDSAALPGITGPSALQILNAHVMPDSAEPTKPAEDLSMAGEGILTSMQLYQVFWNYKGHLVKSFHASVTRMQMGIAMRYIH